MDKEKIFAEPTYYVDPEWKPLVRNRKGKWVRKPDHRRVGAVVFLFCGSFMVLSFFIQLLLSNWWIAAVSAIGAIFSYACLARRLVLKGDANDY